MPRVKNQLNLRGTTRTSFRLLFFHRGAYVRRLVHQLTADRERVILPVPAYFTLLCLLRDPHSFSLDLRIISFMETVIYDQTPLAEYLKGQ